MFGFLFNLKKIRERAHECKHNPEKRKSVSIFGIHSIIYSALQIVFSYGAYYSMCGNTDTGIGIFLIILGFILCALSMYCILGSLFYLSIQLYLNKKPSGWFALLCFIAILVNSGVIIFYL